MIPIIRSLSELMAITESREGIRHTSESKSFNSSTVDSGQRKRYLKSLDRKETMLPDLPKIIRRKWIDKKESISKFIDDLDYNNQIQSSYDLTLLERQNKKNKQDVA